MLELAERFGDVDMKIQGLLVTGYNLVFSVNAQLGLQHIEEGIALYNSQRKPARHLGIGPNP